MYERSFYDPFSYMFSRGRCVTHFRLNQASNGWSTEGSMTLRSKDRYLIKHNRYLDR